MVCVVSGIYQSVKQDVNTGEVRTTRLLHVVLERTKSSPDNLVGNEVATIFVPFDISNVQVGHKYKLEYEVKGKFSKLVDIIEINKEGDFKK